MHRRRWAEKTTTDPLNAIVGPATTGRGAELAVCALVLDVEATEAVVEAVIVEGPVQGDPSPRDLG